METLVDFFKNKKILITGDTGFKGAWLSLWLSRLEARVFGFALPPSSEPNLFTAAQVGKKIKHAEGDVRNLSDLANCFREAEPEIVFHLAAQSLVRTGYEEPKQTFDTNVGGSVNLFECVRQTPSVKVVINITTDKCYENLEQKRAFVEKDPLGGKDPYSASKAAAELVSHAYAQSYFQNGPPAIATARAGNVIGGGDWSKDRLIPDIVRAWAQKEPVILRNPNSVRPWQHVLDVLHGYLLLAHRLWHEPKNFTGAWNFGPEAIEPVTVQEIVQMFLQIWGGGNWRAEENSNNKIMPESHWLTLDCSKARTHLGWQPLWNCKDSIRETVDWYKQYYQNPAGASVHSIAQIEAFMKLAS